MKTTRVVVHPFGRTLVQMVVAASLLSAAACQDVAKTGTSAAPQMKGAEGKAGEATTASSRVAIGSTRRVMAVTRTVFATGTNIWGGAATGLAVDANDNIFVAENVGPGDNFNLAKVSLVTPGGQKSDAIPVGNMVGATGLAVDASGNLYAASGLGYLAAGTGVTPGNKILKRTPNGQISTFISGISNPTGLTFDSAGNLYVASWTDNAVYKYSPSGQAMGVFATGFDNRPYGLATDASDNIYVSAAVGNGAVLGDFARSGRRIYKVTPAGASSVFYTAPFGGEPGGLAFDAEGHLWASYYNSLKIVRVAPGGSAVVHSPYDAGQPADTANGLAIDSQGNLYGQMNTKTIVKWSGLAPVPVQDCSAAEARVADLEANLAAVSSQLSVAQANATQLEADKAALADQLAAANAANASLESQLAAATAANASLTSQLAAANAANTQLQAQLDATNSSLSNAMTSLQSALRTRFRNPGFTIPGATALEQMQNVISSVLDLNKGRLKGVYKGLGGKPGNGDKDDD